MDQKYLKYYFLENRIISRLILQIFNVRRNLTSKVMWTTSSSVSVDPLLNYQNFWNYFNTSRKFGKCLYVTCLFSPLLASPYKILATTYVVHRLLWGINTNILKSFLTLWFIFVVSNNIFRFEKLEKKKLRKLLSRCSL